MIKKKRKISARELFVPWADRTWEVTYGCSECSAGCAYCLVPQFLNLDKDPFNKKKKIMTGAKVTYNGGMFPSDTPRVIVVSACSDLFHEDIWNEYILRTLHRISKDPINEYVIITRRPRRMVEVLKEFKGDVSRTWFGVSVSTQSDAEADIPELLSIGFKNNIVCYEPVLGELDLSSWLDRIKFVTISFHEKTEQYDNWANFILKQCGDYKIPVFVKPCGKEIISPHLRNTPWGLK